MTKLFYLGPQGSYSYLAAVKMNAFFSQKKQLQEIDTICNIFDAIDIENSIGIIPLENTTSGDVYDTYTFLFEQQVQVLYDVIIPIKHALIVQKGTTLDDIQVIYSHPQALMQISSFSNKMQLQTIATNSTSEACLLVLQKNDKHIAAVAQRDAIAKIEELEVLNIDIANHEENYTRFLVIKKAVQQHFQGNLLFMLFSLKTDEPGGLTKILEVLAQNNINLKSIKSRPIEGGTFQYYFIIEANCSHMDDVEHQVMKEKLHKATAKLSYSVYEEATI